MLQSRHMRRWLVWIGGLALALSSPAAALEPDDYVAQQLSLRQVRAQVAWDVETGSSNEVVVAVLDSGVDWSHPELAPNLWNNPDEICDNGVDEDGNGFIDDCHGWDFVDADPVSDDPLGRGTHVAGIVAAVGNNGSGIAGISWGAKIMPVRVMAGTINDLRVTPSQAARAIRYAADEGAQVIHISFVVEEEDEGLRQAIEHALAAGAVIVAAAGDDSHNLDKSPVYPAAWDYDGMLSVAALDQGAKLALRSNYGPTTVTLSGPGIEVFSTLPSGLQGRLSGTPQAAAHVTGAAALLWSNQPNLSAKQVTEKIERTAGRRGILEGQLEYPAVVDMGLLIADKADPVDAHIEAPTKVRTGEKVPFDGTSSEGQVVEYLWKFGDPIDHFGPVVIREWTRPGSVGIELMIRTADGRTATAQHRIEIERKGLIGCAVGSARSVPTPAGVWLACLGLFGFVVYHRRRGW